MKPFLANERSRCAPQFADDPLDLGAFGRARRGRRGRLGVVDLDIRHQFGDGRPDCRPVRLGIVAGVGEGFAKPGQSGLVAERGQAGAAQQRPQRRIAERRPVEFSKMRVAALVPQQYGIADVVKGGAVLAGGQRPAHGGGEIVKTHQDFFRGNRIWPSRIAHGRRRPIALQPLEK